MNVRKMSCKRRFRIFICRQDGPRALAGAHPGAAHENVVGAQVAVTGAISWRIQAPVGCELPGVVVVSQQHLEHRVQLLLRAPVLDRRDDLDPVVEVARHQVAAAQVVALLVAGLEM